MKKKDKEGEHSKELEDVDYISIKPKRTRYVRTKFIHRGRRKPLKYDLED